LRIFKVVKGTKSFRDIKTVIEKPRKRVDALNDSRPKKLLEKGYSRGYGNIKTH